MNSLVDEVDCLRFELVGAVQVGQDEDLGGVLHRQTGAQGVLTHNLQSLQSILSQTGDNKRKLVIYRVSTQCRPCDRM